MCYAASTHGLARPRRTSPSPKLAPARVRAPRAHSPSVQARGRRTRVARVRSRSSGRQQPGASRARSTHASCRVTRHAVASVVRHLGRRAHHVEAVVYALSRHHRTRRRTSRRHDASARLHASSLAKSRARRPNAACHQEGQRPHAAVRALAGRHRGRPRQAGASLEPRAPRDAAASCFGRTCARERGLRSERAAGRRTAPSSTFRTAPSSTFRTGARRERACCPDGGAASRN